MKFKVGDKVNVIDYINVDISTGRIEKVPVEDIEYPWAKVIEEKIECEIKNIEKEENYPYIVKVYIPEDDDYYSEGFTETELEHIKIKNWKLKLEGRL